jgi:hypothetical protein
MYRRIFGNTATAVFIISATALTLVAFGAVFAEANDRNLGERAERETTEETRDGRDARPTDDSELNERENRSNRPEGSEQAERDREERAAREGEEGDEPGPTLGHIIISEVYYDVDGEHGSEPSNEWVEIYNPTDEDVDMGGWSIADAASSDVLPGGAVVPAGGYLVIVGDASTPTETLWEMPEGAVVVMLDNASIGNGLGNTGDAVFLRNIEEVDVDSVSWGGNVDAFDPSVNDATEGHSIERVELDVDTDTASDWRDNSEPSPGENIQLGLE